MTLLSDSAEWPNLQAGVMLNDKPLGSVKGYNSSGKWFDIDFTDKDTKQGRLGRFQLNLKVVHLLAENIVVSGMKLYIDK